MIQELPFKDRPIVPIIKDELVEGVWPQFMKPYPLSEKYFLVACKPAKDALWGIYLVDVFDNLTLIAEQEGEGLTAPIPLVKTRNTSCHPFEDQAGQQRGYGLYPGYLRRRRYAGRSPGHDQGSPYLRL